MAKGVDTGSHPRRQVGAGSGPWTTWANRTTVGGSVQASASNTYDPRFPHQLWVEPGSGGKYRASYEHHDPGTQGRTYVSTYEAGTQFRSPERAKLASEALSNRVTRGRGSARNYRSQSYYEKGER